MNKDQIKIKDLEDQLEKEKLEKTRLIKELEELSKIRTYYNALMQNTEDYILICNSKCESQAFNARYKQRGEELLKIEIKPGIQAYKLSGNIEAIRYWDSLQQRVLKGEQFIAEYGDKELGLYFETLFSPIREDGKITGFTEITRDITARKQIEKALQESDAFSSSLLEYSPTAIVVYNPDTSIRYVNPFFERLTGYSSEDVLGLKIPYPWSVEDAKYGSIEKRQREGVKRSEREYRKKDGSHSWAEIDVTPIYKDGELIYSLGTWIDIAERKQAEQEQEKLQRQLQQAQKMEAIGNLAGGIAHDYNNISSIIMGYAELALTTIDPADPLHGYISHILEASKRAADITKQLLAFARKQTIAPKVLGLNETIESMLPMIKRLIGEDIELVWVPDGEAWPVNMDPTQIDQILVNLCVNARDAIENTGKITIETGNIIFDEEYCSDHLGFSAGKYTMIAVSDDGVGMTAEQQGKIFEPFFTTKDSGRGTGLGLSTIYGIVKQNNGFVNVYSEYGKGSTFRVYLPKEDVLQPARPVVKKTEIPSFGKGQTIMVVEDDNVIMELVEMILKNYKYNVISSSTPTQAIALADKYLGKIDLLVTDTVLPEMNGRELANELCKKQADLKVLFMSGYTANVITHRGALDEEINFIAKPFSLVDFAAKVKEVLES